MLFNYISSWHHMVPIKGLVEMRSREKAFHTHTSQLSPPPHTHQQTSMFLFLQSFSLIQATPSLISSAFQCILLPPPPQYSTPSCLPVSLWGVWSCYSICQSDTVVKKRKRKNIPHPFLVPAEAFNEQTSLHKQIQRRGQASLDNV